jgi:selT/selW/selH-like putative selenoprotein
LAAELENRFNESSHLIQSSGGVFEVETDDGQLLFSKKAQNRFPEDGEVEEIVKLVASGTPLEKAREEAGKNAKKPPSFVEWFTGKFLQSSK